MSLKRDFLEQVGGRRYNRLHLGRFDNHSFKSLRNLVGLVAAVVLLAAWAAPGAAHRGDQIKQSAERTWHTTLGTVTSRGPYQGDSSVHVYRIVTIQYVDPSRSDASSSIERMFPWDTTVGQHMDMAVAANRTPWVDGDMKGGKDPRNPRTAWPVVVSLVWHLIVVAAVAILLAMLTYWLAVSLAALNQMHPANPSPA